MEPGPAEEMVLARAAAGLLEVGAAAKHLVQVAATAVQAQAGREAKASLVAESAALVAADKGAAVRLVREVREVDLLVPGPNALGLAQSTSWFPPKGNDLNSHPSRFAPGLRTASAPKSLKASKKGIKSSPAC
jgi:hypothetical protein